MKTCTKCNLTLAITDFHKKTNGKHGLGSQCKLCVKSYQQSYKGSLILIFCNQKTNSKHRIQPPPSYSWEELVQWVEANGFKQLYKQWSDSGFERKFAPSVDRLDESSGYSLDNIQLITWQMNNAKGHRDRFTGALVVNHTSVSQFDQAGNFIATYCSQAEAYRSTGVSQGNIGEVCRHIRATAGGFKWEYTNG